MEEQDFEQMKADIGTREWISDNCYRGVAIGSMLWEFVTFEENKRYVLFINVYEAGSKTANYGILDDGTSYDHIDLYEAGRLGLNPDGDFDEFKNLVQRKIIAMANEENHIKEMIETDIEPAWHGFGKE